MPFLVCAIPGMVLALGVCFLKEPQRGASDHLADSLERGTVFGLFHNKAYWTVSLGMAMMTFAVGGLQVWMPTFLSRMRGVPLEHANLLFGVMTLFSGTASALAGGWVGDHLLRKNVGA